MIMIMMIMITVMIVIMLILYCNVFTFPSLPCGIAVLVELMDETRLTVRIVKDWYLNALKTISVSLIVLCSNTTLGPPCIVSPKFHCISDTDHLSHVSSIQCF